MHYTAYESYFSYWGYVDVNSTCILGCLSTVMLFDGNAIYVVNDGSEFRRRISFFGCVCMMCRVGVRSGEAASIVKGLHVRHIKCNSIQVSYLNRDGIIL